VKRSVHKLGGGGGGGDPNTPEGGGGGGGGGVELPKALQRTLRGLEGCVVSGWNCFVCRYSNVVNTVLLKNCLAN